MLAFPAAAEIVRLHEDCLARPVWPLADPAEGAAALWREIEANHCFNSRLWDEEDQARRRDVPDAAIIERTGLKAFTKSIGILGTCIKEAPEFANRKRKVVHGTRTAS